MSSIDWEDDDPFEDQREQIENPMKRLFSDYGRPNWVSITLGIIGSIFSRVLDLLPPLMLGIAIDSIFLQSERFSLPLVPPAWLPAGREAQFVLVTGVIVASFVLAAGFHWIRNWGFNAFSQNIQHAMRVDTYDQMQRLNMEFFADKQTGELMSILSNDINQLERFLNDGLNALFRMLVMVVAIAGFLLYLNWQLALIALLPVPLIAGFTYLFIQIIQPRYAKVRSAVGDLNSRLENNLGGIQVIKTSHTEEYESERVTDVSREYYDTNWDAIRVRIKFFPGLRLLSGVGFGLTFLVGGWWVFQGTAPGPLTGSLGVGTFVVFIIYTQRFVWPVAQFGEIINKYQRARASSARIFGLLDESIRLAEREGLHDLHVTAGRVEFDDVSFEYDRDEVTLKDINLTVDGGETVALVGPTGAGKSTILMLLARLYDVDEGAITIDGTDIRDVTLASLRESLGYVSQNTFLFHGSVAENISYGSFDADHAAVVDAAKAARAHEFIMNLPDGYDTQVGERGVKLSGGQRQRIAIARVILEDPDILILDEATSDVDTETEMLIQRSISQLTKTRTTFAIAHRLSTIKDADTIAVIENGRIIERGTHEELLANDGLYSHLWSVQAGEIDELPQEFIDRATRRRAETEVT